MKKIKLEKPTSGSQLVLQTLKELGVEIIFGYPGGAMLPLYDAIHNFEGIQHILARKEQRMKPKVTLNRLVKLVSSLLRLDRERLMQ